MEALVSIAFGVGVECLAVEIPDDRALLLESTEITFSDEDMEVGYGSRITRPQEALLPSSIHKSNSHKDSLSEYRCFCKSHSIKHFTSSRNFRKKDLRMPNGSDRVWRKRQVHHRPHLAVVESRPHSFFSLVSCGENRSILSCAFGKAMVA